MIHLACQVITTLTRCCPQTWKPTRIFGPQAFLLNHVPELITAMLFGIGLGGLLLNIFAGRRVRRSSCTFVVISNGLTFYGLSIRHE